MSKGQFATICVLLGAIAVLEAAPIVAPDRTGPSFEYRIEAIKDEELVNELNRIGNAGWRIVFARRAIATGDEGKGIYEIMFERPK